MVNYNIKEAIEASFNLVEMVLIWVNLGDLRALPGCGSHMNSGNHFSFLKANTHLISVISIKPTMIIFSYE